ncbi:13716_t:CDS:10 [Funneliformis geosporum]|nr:13716_t:CDS:10 [Funneliformis geosporum]
MANADRDFDNDDEFLYGGIEEQTVVESQVSKEGEETNDIGNFNDEASKEVNQADVDSIKIVQVDDQDMYFPPEIKDHQTTHVIHDDKTTQSTFVQNYNIQGIQNNPDTKVNQDNQVINTSGNENNQDKEDYQDSQEIQEGRDMQDIDPLEMSTENGNSIEGVQASSSRTPGVDINVIGTFEGTGIYDVDLDSFEDKPWRKPGADITDYFNYGFNEYTWKAYCAKQKQMREDQHQRKKIHVYESKQEMNNLPELQSINQSSSGGQEHNRFPQQRGRGRRGRDQDDSVIQVVSSEREAALEELEPIPPPSMDQSDEFNMEGGYPQNFSGNPMGMGMFPPPEMGGPMGPPPSFFMSNPDMPPTGPMGFDPSYRGQPMRNMMRPGGMPGSMPGGMPGMPGMPGMARGMPPNMQGGIPGGMPMPRGMPGIPGGIPGGMVGRGRGMPMEERPYFSMDEPTWEMENRNSPSFRPGHGGFQGRPPTGPMLGPSGNRPDWEHSPPPDAPFAHRMRPPFRPPTGPAGSSVNSPSSDREEERGGDRSASGSVERSHGFTRREDERWDGSRKRTTGDAPRDDDEIRAKRRH